MMDSESIALPLACPPLAGLLPNVSAEALAKAEVYLFYQF